MSEVKLSRSLDAVVEDCVNAVGVDVNTASAPLLSRVSGITAGLAQNIVATVTPTGRSVPVPTAGSAAVGTESVRTVRGLPADSRRGRPVGLFKRPPGGVSGGAAHPRGDRPGYPGAIGDTDTLRSLRPDDFVDERFGLPTVTDILAELEKPGRDPRPEFQTAAFREGVEEITDLEPGMVLEGVVTNVAAFGAFVDVGVHHDGLVHVSAMSKSFVKDPRDVVKPGDIVRVKVLDVDVRRKRISLTLRLDEKWTAQRGERRSGGQRRERRRAAARRGRAAARRRRPRRAAALGAMAEALRRAGLA